MTRAEAIKILERRTTIPGDGYTFEQINEALDLALAALRGPARAEGGVLPAPGLCSATMGAGRRAQLLQV